MPTSRAFARDLPTTRRVGTSRSTFRRRTPEPRGRPSAAGPKLRPVRLADGGAIRQRSLDVFAKLPGQRGFASSTRESGAAGGEGRAVGPRRYGHRGVAERFCDERGRRRCVGRCRRRGLGRHRSRCHQIEDAAHRSAESSASGPKVTVWAQASMVHSSSRRLSQPRTASRRRPSIIAPPARA